MKDEELATNALLHRTLQLQQLNVPTKPQLELLNDLDKNRKVIVSKAELDALRAVAEAAPYCGCDLGMEIGHDFRCLLGIALATLGALKDGEA